MVAVRVIALGPADAGGTVKLTTTVYDAPGASAGSVHGRDGHPATPAGTRPGGVGASRVTPAVADGPALVIVIVKVAVAPRVTTEGPVIVTCTSAPGAAI